ncbi:cytochrome o ubiquinol oxidase subunit I [Buchnera aphidicola]|uniref:cytochrome o ubiquinol oxidase subunit I n=1 Tax=Buchnera aphidicola TaxID=9 RepID=UPI0031B81A16
MFGKLTLKDIPYHEPIIIITCMIIFFISFFVFLQITKLRKWKYLWLHWLTSVDHKKISIMYLVLALIMLFRGFTDALMMRLQQFFASSNGNGFLPPHHYDQIFTVHGVIMIFFVAMPLIFSLMNFIIPLQIGARDVAFPVLNNLSFWFTASSAILLNFSLIIGEFARTGWLAYPPLSEIQYSPGVGVDYWIWSLQIAGIGTTLSGINFIVTILKMRAPGMNMFKMPVFIWTTLCSNVLIIASFPVLTMTLILLSLDRYLGFHFFTNDLNGNSMMYVNLIWIWGHPEVYILILPAFGVFSEVVATFSQKKLFGYYSLVWATIAITILSFIVWLHHFFTMGAGSNVNAFFGITTMIIAIPTGVKIFNWLFTLYQGRIKLHSAMLWTIGFLVTFTIGGMAGVVLSIPAIDFLLHNSVFLVAHFHTVIIGGVVFGCFAGINYWFPKFFGFKLNEYWGKISFYFWFIGFFVAFMPLYYLGFMGMTRRLGQNINHNFHFMLFIAAIGSFLILIGIICQIIQLYISIKYKKFYIDNSGDPWNGRTLEWSTSSPPPVYNFSHIPHVIDVDDFWYKKKNNLLNRNNIYHNIHIPENTALGVILGIFSLLFGFSMIWYIWWMCIFSVFFVIVIFYIYMCKKEKFIYIKSMKIKEIEDKYFINYKKK